MEGSGIPAFRRLPVHIDPVLGSRLPTALVDVIEVIMSKEKIDVSTTDVAAEVAALKADVAAHGDPGAAGGPLGDILSPEGPIPGGALESDIEVESTFWDNEVVDIPDGVQLEEEASPDTAEDQPAGEEPEGDIPEQSEASDEQLIRFKANGVEQELTMEEAKKQLALVQGARKAFNDRAKTQQRVKKLEAQLKDAVKAQESWAKLEALRETPERIIEVVMGQSLDDLVQKKLEREKLYASATPEERQMLDQDYRLEQMERQLERERKDRESAKAEVARIQEETATAAQKSRLDTAFEQFNVKVEDPQLQSRISKYVWKNAISDLKDYHKAGYDVTNPKVIAKAFKDVAATVNAVHGKEVDRGVKKAIDKHKTAAKEKAQVASTTNYPKTKAPDFGKMNPSQIFDSFFGSKKKGF